MNGFEAYRTYLAIKQHFNDDSFDYFKYNGKVNVKVSSFERRVDKIFFEKLAKVVNTEDYLVANHLNNNKIYIRDLFTEEAKRTYNEWSKTQQSLSYIYKQNLSKLESDFDSNFFCVSEQHPIFLKKLVANEINLETICILLDITKSISYFVKKLEEDIVASMYLNKIRKYTPFIKFDRQQYKKITLDYFNQ